ncbi:hypothetical protein GCM10010199_01190 [Dactylosporangium roseum]
MSKEKRNPTSCGDGRRHHPGISWQRSRGRLSYGAPVTSAWASTRWASILSEADLARNLEEHQLAEFIENVYATS